MNTNSLIELALEQREDENVVVLSDDFVEVVGESTIVEVAKNLIEKQNPGRIIEIILTRCYKDFFRRGLYALIVKID